MSPKKQRVRKQTKKPAPKRAMPPHLMEAEIKRLVSRMESNLLPAIESAAVPDDPLTMDRSTFLLTLLTLFPIEEMLAESRRRQMTVQNRALLDIPELRVEGPSDALSELLRWHQAALTGNIKLYLSPDGRRWGGLRAELPLPVEADSMQPVVWQGELSAERIPALVSALIAALS